MDEGSIELRKLGIGYQTKHGVRSVAEGITGVIRSRELTCLLGPVELLQIQITKIICFYFVKQYL